MNIDRSATTCFQSHGITYCDVCVNDDGEAPLLDIFAEVRGWRSGDGLWEHHATDVREIKLRSSVWSVEADGCWANTLPIWNEDIADECERCYQAERELDAETAADRVIDGRKEA